MELLSMMMVQKPAETLFKHQQYILLHLCITFENSKLNKPAQETGKLQLPLTLGWLCLRSR